MAKMIAFTIADFLNRFRVDGGDTCIYVFRDGRRVYYVGKSVAAAGIISRLDAHLWLKRQYDGNRIKVYVEAKYARQVQLHMGNDIKQCDRKSDGRTLFQVGVAGLDKLAQARKALRTQWGTDSPIGQYVLDNLPESRNWQIELYTLDECRPEIHRYVSTNNVNVEINVDSAEVAMIWALNPTRNSQHTHN